MRSCYQLERVLWCMCKRPSKRGGQEISSESDFDYIVLVCLTVLLTGLSWLIAAGDVSEGSAGAVRRPLEAAAVALCYGVHRISRLCVQSSLPGAMHAGMPVDIHISSVVSFDTCQLHNQMLRRSP